MAESTGCSFALQEGLWRRLSELCGRHDVKFEWVKGHSGHPMNERCDQLAVGVKHAEDLPSDVAYESGDGSEVE